MNEATRQQDRNRASRKSRESSESVKASEPFLRITLPGLAAPLCWVLHFAVVYLLEGLLCGPALSGMIPYAIALATLLGAGICSWQLYASRVWLEKAGAAQLQSLDFLVYISRMLALLALLAILWAGLGAIFVQACAAVY